MTDFDETMLREITVNVITLQEGNWQDMIKATQMQSNRGEKTRVWRVSMDKGN